MREKGEGVPRRHNPGFGCEEVRTIEASLLHIRRSSGADTALVDTMMEAYRQVIDTRQVELLKYREEQAEYLQQDWRRVLRVKRLLNVIDDESWKTILQRQEKSNYKVTAWVHLLEMYTTVTIETLARVSSLSSASELQAVYSEFLKVKAYTIEQATAISKVYGCVMPRALRDEKKAVALFP
jgi:hypothetical protein